MDKNLVLNDDLLEQLFFGMENQKKKFFLNMQTLKVIDADEILPADEDHVVRIPKWQPVDGFNLMESFINTLHNPIAREELHRSLQGGQGVFREFKKTLKNYREVERLWFAFRKRKMKKRVLEWVDAIMESEAFTAFTDEISEHEDLVLSDFTVQPVDDAEKLGIVSEWDKQAFEELFLLPEHAQYWHAFYRDHLPSPQELEQGSFVLGIFNPAGEICAFLWALHDEISVQKSVAHILQIYTEPVWRGLGMAGTLINIYLKHCEEEGIGTIVFTSFSNVLENIFKREGFTQSVSLYGRGSFIAMK